MSFFAKYGHFSNFGYKVAGMNISFTTKQEKYIADQLESGDYQNASEVVRDAMRLHQLYREKVLEDLRKDISIGWDGPESTLRVSDIIKRKKSK